MKQDTIGCQWHQLYHTQIICTSLQTDNQASTSSFGFHRSDALPDAQPRVSKDFRQFSDIYQLLAISTGISLHIHVQVLQTWPGCFCLIAPFCHLLFPYFYHHQSYCVQQLLYADIVHHLYTSRSNQRTLCSSNLFGILTGSFLHKWHLDPSSHLATTALPPLGEGGGAGSPSNTMWPGPRPTCVPSFILIRPTVWRQYTNVTDRTGQDRTDRQR